MVSSSEDSDEAGNLEVVVALSLSLATCSFDNGMSFFIFIFAKTEREREHRKGRKVRFSGIERKVTISPSYHYLKTTVITK